MHIKVIMCNCATILTVFTNLSFLSFAVLALVWQLMRAYTLSMLTRLAGQDGHPILEKEIVEWVNEKVDIIYLRCQVKLQQQ